MTYRIQNSSVNFPYHGVVPVYLCELIKKYHTVKSLKSNNMMFIKEYKN